MKNLITPVITVLLIIGCSNSTSDVKNEEVETFEDSYYNDIRKSHARYSIVNQLYSEALKNNEHLKDLDNRIQNADNNVKELVDDYTRFLNHNKDYYNQALNLIDYQIKDSLLKVKTRKEYEAKLNSFNESVSILNNTNKTIQSLALSLDDTYILLKLKVTNDLIVKYQNNQFPENEKLEEAINHYEQLIKECNKI